LVVLKRNVIENNGGIEVRGHTTNVVVEGNTVRNSSVGIHVNTSQATHVYLHGNDEQVQ
jgi:parallel beta-helix repeat protein